MFRYAHCSALILMLSVCGGPATAENGQHEGDIIVGRSLSDQLKIEADVDQAVLCLPNSGGLLFGWTEVDPGFEHLHNDEPGEDFYSLESGANIYLEIVSIQSGLKIWEAGLTALADETGEQIQIGDDQLHSHATWHLDSNVLGTEWEGILSATFKLIDTGSTGYADSASFDMTFTNFRLRGDVTGEGFVGADDLVRILTNWGQSGSAVGWSDGDVAPYPDGDEFIGADDYVEVLTYWGSTYPAEPVPEPATLGLLLGAAVGLLRGHQARQS